MSDPAKLREASEKVLYGLRADDTLKQKILIKAAAGGDAGSRRAFRPLPVFCGVVAALLVAVIALNGLEPAVPAGSVEINVFAAGDNETVSPAEDGTGEAAVLCHIIHGRKGSCNGYPDRFSVKVFKFDGFRFPAPGCLRDVDPDQLLQRPVSLHCFNNLIELIPQAAVFSPAS